MKKFLPLVVLLLFTVNCLAQDATVKGTVTDAETSEPLPFVNVSLDINGEIKGAQTDFDGNFTFDVPEGKHDVSFSSVGYSSQKITIKVSAGDVTTLNVSMKEESQLIDEFEVVSGGKFDKPRSEITEALTVIKPETVDGVNPTSVDQAVERMPGVDVVDGQANIRGGSGYSYGAGSRVMLLMDGLPVLTADAGFPNWDFLPIENLGQIEIIKGAGSVLYGSSAMNGVINFRTAYPTSEPQTEFMFFSGVYQRPQGNNTGLFTYENPDGDEYLDADGNAITDRSLITGEVADSNELKKAWWGGALPYETGGSFSHRQKYGKFDLVLGANINLTDRWREFNYRRQMRSFVGTRYRFDNGMSVGLNVNYTLNTSASYLIWNLNNDNQGAAGAYRLFSATPPINNIGNKVTIDPFWEWNDYARGMKHKLMGRYYKNNNINDTNQSTKSDFFYGEYQFSKEFEQADFTVYAGLVSSLALADAELYGDTIYTASNLAGYIQLDKKFFDRLTLSVGARYERNTIGKRESDLLEGETRETEAKPVFRAGANLQVAEYTYVRAAFGEAYRFPTIAEKFIQTTLGAFDVANLSVDVGIFPNQSLRSETGWSAEIGLMQGIKISEWKGLFEISAFVNEYNDMMEFTFGVNDALIPLLQNGVPPLGIEPIWPELDTVVIKLDGQAAAGFQSINIGDTRIFGIDASLAGTGKVGNIPLSLLLGYTYIDPRFQNFDRVQQILSSSDNNVLKYRFRHTVKADAELTFGKVSIGGSARYYSEMEAVDEAFNIFLPGVKEFREDNKAEFILDSRVRYNFSETSEIALIVRNLTNNEYALRPALVDAPRNFTIRYRHKFGKTK